MGYLSRAVTFPILFIQMTDGQVPEPSYTLTTVAFVQPLLSPLTHSPRI